MGFFTYIYYHTFIATYHVSVGDLMESAITGLTPEEQVELIRGMGRYLSNQGVVKDSVSPLIARKQTGSEAVLTALQVLACLDNTLPTKR
jgi:hypothetical protein